MAQFYNNDGSQRVSDIYEGAVLLTPGGAAQSPNNAFKGVSVACTVAGDVVLLFKDGSSITVPVVVGFAILPFAILRVTSSTATAVFNGLR